MINHIYYQCYDIDEFTEFRALNLIHLKSTKYLYIYAVKQNALKI